MKLLSNNKKLVNVLKRGTAFALTAVFLVNVPLVNATTAGEEEGKNIRFAKNCYYNRTVESTKKKCYVCLKLFKNATTTSEYTTNPQTLRITGTVYYFDGSGNKNNVSLNVKDDRQTTVIGHSVCAPDNYKFVGGSASFLVAGSQQGKTLGWNN